MRNLFAILLFVALSVAVLTKVPQKFAATWFDQTPQNDAVVAIMTPQSGGIFYRSQAVNGQTEVHFNTPIKFENNAKAEFQLKDSNFEFQLISATASFKKHKDNLLLILHSGEYLPVAGQDKAFKILKNSKFYAPNTKINPSPVTYRPIVKDAITQAPLIVSDQFNDLPKAVDKPKTNKKIAEVLDSEPDNAFLDQLIAEQTEKLQNCQVNRVRDLGTVKGQVMIGLEIHPTGVIKNAKILSTDIEDTELMNCLLSVFERIKLPKYKGEIIFRSYPLLFE
ncbi:MAG: AgmX/PglI C-terminal domain-containing protein [Bdellovibrionales bacterium]|nr:AgmX/PglI C-terminal domain-containing protein [Bdellovibrionales bacterium]